MFGVLILNVFSVESAAGKLLSSSMTETSNSHLHHPVNKNARLAGQARHKEVMTYKMSLQNFKCV